MHFTQQQDRALCAAADWLRSPEQQIFRLFGYAGTGKTTLAKHLAEDIDGRVIFAAFTGKAAHVMRSKGCKDATTLHSLIYTCTETEDGPQFELTDSSPLAEAELLIVDECSMVDETLGQDLLSFGKPILVLGDPAQLPPIHGAGFFIADTPDVTLTDVQRQACDNPIIHMATTIRQGGILAAGDYGSSRVVNWSLSPAELAATDQILVGRNDTRRFLNAKMRDHHGHHGAIPQPGDRLVCLRNNHLRGLLNGSTWITKAALAGEDNHIFVAIVPDDDATVEATYTKSHLAFFRGTADRELKYFEQRKLDQFDFGYALTVHKAQGSQWPDIVLFNQASTFGHNARKWLYTAITRAVNRITIVQK